MKKEPQNRRETGLIEAGKPTRFQPGQSGNPGGRPSTKLLSDELRRRLAMRVPTAMAKRLRLRLTATYAEAVAATLIQEACEGSVAATHEIMDRLEGRVAQALRLDPASDFSLQIFRQNDDAIIQKLLGDALASDTLRGQKY